MDRVAETLAHLLVAVETRQPAELREERPRLDEHVAEEVVEPADRLTRQFQVRHLVLPNRHEARVVDRDIRRLEQGIAQEADGRQVLVLQVLLLLLVGRHALEPGNRHDHREEQVQLGVFGDERLDEQRALLRIESGGDPVGDILIRKRRQLRRAGVVAGQRVPVGHEVVAVVLLLQRHPVAQRADKVTQVQLSRGTHARDDPGLSSRRGSSHCSHDRMNCAGVATR